MPKHRRASSTSKSALKTSHHTQSERCTRAAFEYVDPEKKRIYNDFILAHLSQLARKVYTDMIDIKNYEWQSDWAKSHIAEGVKQGIEQGLKQGLERGVEQGREQGQLSNARSMLARLISKRFGDLSEEQQARIDAADLPSLEAATDRIFTAETPDDVI